MLDRGIFRTMEPGTKYAFLVLLGAAVLAVLYLAYAPIFAPREYVASVQIPVAVVSATPPGSYMHGSIAAGEHVVCGVWFRTTGAIDHTTRPYRVCTRDHGRETLLLTGDYFNRLRPVPR